MSKTYIIRKLDGRYLSISGWTKYYDRARLFNKKSKAKKYCVDEYCQIIKLYS